MLVTKAKKKSRYRFLVLYDQCESQGNGSGDENEPAAGRQKTGKVSIEEGNTLKKKLKRAP